MLRLVQLKHPTEGRRVAVVEEPELRLLSHFTTVYDLAQAALNAGHGLTDLIAAHRSPQALAYDDVYELRSPWRLRVPFNHPDEPARCLITGTGLTHKASAENRQSMHLGGAASAEPVTDSLRMYRIGLE